MISFYKLVKINHILQFNDAFQKETVIITVVIISSLFNIDRYKDVIISVLYCDIFVSC